MRSIVAILMIGVLAFALQAKEVTGLYEAQVPANVSQSQWQQSALQQVLVKVSANPDVLEQGAVKAELGNAANYLKKFEPVAGPAPLLKVTLDEQKVQQFLTSLQVPVWGSRRPAILFWPVEQTADSRQFLQGPDQPVLQLLKQQAEQRALPWLLPSADANFATSLSQDDVWAGNWLQIDQASLAFQPDQTMILLFDQPAELAPQVRLTWQSFEQGQLVSQQLVADDQIEAVRQFIEQQVNAQASQYAVRLGANATELELQIDGVTNFVQMVQVQKVLAAMLSVQRVQVQARQADSLSLKLQLESDAQTFLNALRLDRRFQAEQSDNNSALVTEPLQSPVAEESTDQLFAELEAEMAAEQQQSAAAPAVMASGPLRFRFVPQ
ncbi:MULTISPECIES: DUF2066 domain-containing protein [Rheinheimera]|uniref:DUF2066 domain-containing protein n=1 Tax=Rheinheimera marina TaxID=1774958 RepID=A0ABV9JR06_9GAMM